MKTQAWATLFLAMFVCALPEARADGPPRPPSQAKGEDVFVSTVGDHSRHGGKLTLKVYVQDGRLNYRVCRDEPTGGKSESGPSKPAIEIGSPWFIYSDTPDEVWIFDGSNSLCLRPFHDRRPEFANGGFYEVLRTRRTLDMMPGPVRDRLPEAFRAKFRDE